MEKTNQSELTTNMMKILKGSMCAFIISIIGFIIFASILTCTNVKENIIPSVVIIISLISLLIGSYISARKIKKRGIINGAIVGIIYIISIYILSSISLVGFSLNVYSIIMIIGAVIAGMIWGVAGVNLS